MIDQSKINIIDIFLKQTITLFVMHLYQLFSWFRNEMKRITNVSRKSRKKKSENFEKKKTIVSSVILTKINVNENKTIKWISKKYLNILNNFSTTFNVFAILSKNLNFEKHLNFSFECAKTNQSFDLVIINEQLTKILKFKFRSSKKLNKKNVKMIVVNDDNHVLIYWMIVHINVKNIKRKIWTFVNSKYSSTHLFLKLFWLNSIEIKINEKIQEIRIDNKIMMKNVKCINFSWLIIEQLKSNKINIMKQKKSQQLNKIIKKLIIIKNSDDDSKNNNNEINIESLNESNEKFSNSDVIEWEQTKSFH